MRDTSVSMQPMSDSQDIILSIVTASYNDCQRLTATVRSLENFYGDSRFEHIVIDGNSKDETRKYLKDISYHDNFIYLSEPDSGIYDAMNKGVAIANGAYLLFLNCGDQMAASPDYIETSLRLVAAEDLVDIICFDSRVQDKSSSFILKPKFAWPYRMPTSHQAMLFARNFLRLHPYDTCYRIAADFNLYLKADRGRVAAFSGVQPLTTIEAVGIASENPVRSYQEYLRATAENLTGWVKWVAILRIGGKAAVVILFKKGLPRRLLGKLQRKLGTLYYG